MVNSCQIIKTEDIPYLSFSPSSPRPYSFSSTPIFSPEMLELNARSLLSFISEGCKKEEGTYLLTSQEGGEMKLYDLNAMSDTRQMKWTWKLAMLSFRFSVRVSEHVQRVEQREEKERLWERERSLLNTSLELLEELKEMGGKSHLSMRASIVSSQPRDGQQLPDH